MGHETLHGTVPAQMGMLDSTVRRQPVGNRWEMQISILRCASAFEKTRGVVFYLRVFTGSSAELHSLSSRMLRAKLRRRPVPRRAQLWLGYGTAAIKAPHKACASEPGRHGRGRHLAHV